MTDWLAANQKIIPFPGAFRAVIGNHFLNTVFHEEGPPSIWSVYADRPTGSSLISVPVFEQAPIRFIFFATKFLQPGSPWRFVPPACFFCGFMGHLPCFYTGRFS